MVGLSAACDSLRDLPTYTYWWPSGSPAAVFAATPYWGLNWVLWSRNAGKRCRSTSIANGRKPTGTRRS